MNVYIKEPHTDAEACVIWMHGLGASAEDMRGLANILPPAPIRHVFMDAPVRPITINNHIPMRAWYDIVGFTLTDREDQHGILASEQIIHDVIAKQMSEGFTSKQIFLAGFSQGGAMALFTGLRATMPLAGIIALSAYLPLASLCTESASSKMPVFMAMGEYDPIVLPNWTKISYDKIATLGYRAMTLKQYPMEHAICMEEAQDLAHWLNEQISLIKKDGDR